MLPAHTNHTKRAASTTQARNQSTNKSTLAHYRVLKQHTHIYPPPSILLSSCKKRLCRHYINHNPKVKSLTQPDRSPYFLMSASDRFPDRHLTSSTPLRGLSGGALSVSLTHIKLHTPKHQHKSPAYGRFLGERNVTYFLTSRGRFGSSRPVSMSAKPTAAESRHTPENTSATATSPLPTSVLLPDTSMMSRVNIHAM